MQVRKSQLRSVVEKDHLYGERCSTFQSLSGQRPQEHHLPSPLFDTNYGITLAHPYPFVLMHLKANTKNLLAINIPQICIFHNSAPFDLLYEDRGHVRGMRDTQNVKLHKIYSFFLQNSKQRGVRKQEQCVACFENDEYLLMSDTDLFIACRKFKCDPFFKKLVFIKNRLDAVETGIVVDFDDSKDCEFRGEAVESFLGFKTDHQMIQKYGRDLYLKYLTEKIALFLSIEQNIRIRRAQYVFSKTSSGKYFLVDIRNLYYQNFTRALKKREMRLKKVEQDRSNKLLISQKQYQQLKHLQNGPQVQALQQQMNSFFYEAAQKYRVVTDLSAATEANKTEQAFDKLFPKFSSKMVETLSKMNVKSLRKKVLKTEQIYDYPKLTTKKTVPRQFLRTEVSMRRSSSQSKRPTRTYYSFSKQKAFA